MPLIYLLFDQDYQLLKHFYQGLLLDHNYLETHPNHGYLQVKKGPNLQVDEQFLENPLLQGGPTVSYTHLTLPTKA